MKRSILMVAVAGLAVGACTQTGGPDAAMTQASGTVAAGLSTAGPAMETTGAGASDAAATAAAMAQQASGTAGAAAGQMGGTAQAMIDDRLIGRVWQWEDTAAAGGTTTKSPDPAKYTVAFLPAGVVAAMADCKKAGGTYTADEGGAMKFDVKAETTDPCGAGSLADVYLEDLAKVSSWKVDDEYLTLGFTDGGSMRFEAP
jgi:hypothetical protein